MNLQTLKFKKLYQGVDASRDDFLIPAIKNSVTYKRGAGYFSVSSLLSISQGLEELIKKNGKFSLLIGLHDVPPEIIEAQKLLDYWKNSNLVNRRLSDFLNEVKSLSNALHINTIETIALALKDGFLEVKLAKPLSLNSMGIFHIKRIILTDIDGNYVVATGSPNETIAGLSYNFEDLTVFKSWDDSRDYANEHAEAFDELWTGKHPDLEIFDLNDDFAIKLLAALQDAKKNIPPNLNGGNLTEFSQREGFEKFIKAVRNCISYIPYTFPGIRLLPHQEYALDKAISRWPIRVLLGDEVGLGKTIEMGAIVGHLLTVRAINSVMILAPKNLVVQIQDELFEKFGLNFYRWESATEKFISCNKEEVSGYDVFPGGLKAPNLTIASAQWARGSNKRKHVFVDMVATPDLLIVDEAHSARKPVKGSKQSPTLMFQMLKEASKKIPHVILMTATPMQINIEEYLGLLEILGAPYPWTEPSYFNASLDIATNSDDRVPLEQANILLKLVSTALPTLDKKSQIANQISQIIHEVDKEENKAVKASKVRSKWGILKSSMIEVNPASHLTIRNSRKSLEKMGYEFPVRDFKSPDLHVSANLRNFQSKMEDYLRNAYASVESAINPSYEGSKGFVICIYQQRIASSMYSAELSLKRRKFKLEQIREGINQELGLEDEDLLDEVYEIEEIRELPKDEKSKVRIQNAAIREINYLNDLLQELTQIEGGSIYGDPKISSVLKYIAQDSKLSGIIVFSRYTDTLQGIIQAFEDSKELSSTIRIGLYTGSEVWIRDVNGVKVNVSKKELKQSLEKGQVSVIFCSDAASEGLNLQAADKLVNIDVPWNPGRLEQRIGRIARLGQKAKTVEIVNYWYPGSVESRMYSRLLERRELYELAIGSFPQIFSSAIRDSVLAGVNGASAKRDPIIQLEELRDNLQNNALEKMWGASHPSDSKSKKFVGELDEIIRRILKDKNIYGLEDDSGEQISEAVGVLANPIWDKLKLSKNVNGEYRSVYSVEGHNCIWLLAIRENESYIPIPSSELPKLMESIIGIKEFEIRSSWRQAAWKVGDNPSSYWETIEDFLWLPKYKSFALDNLEDKEIREYPNFVKESDLRFVELGKTLVGAKIEN